ncbi:MULTISPECIES: GNAT family N-acetyltransferase [unclassified Yoonia]|uniref:GNAT family N-acetyltransferase n=1 Tax=unclassified Yoonia TaxID=2629118 RepID=UPI002AFFFF66|nr:MULTISPECIES: GNAT family N-acetyltransferase [unclassified Yoonia]
MTVRRAFPDDIDHLLPLFLAFFAEDSITTPAAAVRTNLARMLAADRACLFIAERNGTAIGLASGSLTNGVEFGCTVELEDLYVVPEARGQGLAAQLIGAVVGWATAEGAAGVILVITPEAEQDQSLTRFYARMGFEPLPRITMYRTL